MPEAVKLVTAKPESETRPVDGLTTNDAIVERPSPEPFALFTAVIENDPFDTVGATATDEAAAGGTFCHVGSEGALQQSGLHGQGDIGISASGVGR